MTDFIQYQSPIDAYSGLAGFYQNRRPRYQKEIFDFLFSQLILDQHRPLTAYDVGCGTGIFTRQLPVYARQSLDIVGIEPNEDMRSKAIEITPASMPIRYICGHAEALPIEDNAACLITAASAATWFDRDVFYMECSRTLHAQGILAIAMIRRDISDDGFTVDYEAYQEAALPGFRRGTFENHRGEYGPADFEAELRQHDSFNVIGARAWPWSQELSFDDFMELSLSRSDMKKVVAMHGLESVRGEHKRLFERYANCRGSVTMAWVSEVVVASRR